MIDVVSLIVGGDMEWTSYRLHWKVVNTGEVNINRYDIELYFKRWDGSEWVTDAFNGDCFIAPGDTLPDHAYSDFSVPADEYFWFDRFKIQRLN